MSSRKDHHPEESDEIGAPKDASDGAAEAGDRRRRVARHLIGLSPQYWSHATLLCGDVIGLVLADGVDCYASTVKSARAKGTNRPSPPSPSAPSSSPAASSSSEENCGTAGADGGKRRVTGRKRPRTASTNDTPSGSTEGGIDCPEPRGDDRQRIHARHKDPRRRLVPLSRADLVGVVVCVDRKSHRTSYVIDDGTGLVDCVAWEDGGDGILGNDGGGDVLLPEYGDDGRREEEIRVGDLARVRGRVRVVSVVGGGGTLEAIREVRASSVERVDFRGTGSDGEAAHWLRCVQFGRRMQLETEDPSDGASVRVQGQAFLSGSREVEDDIGTCLGDSTPDDTERTPPTINELLRLESYGRARSDLVEPVRNGPDILRLLGPKFASCASPSSLADYEDDGVVGTGVGGGGGKCRCSASYKSALLYCHCHATSDVLDPCLRFRDAVLEELLRMEGHALGHGGSRRGSVKECSTLKLSSASPPEPLRFQYKTLVHNKSLSAVASSVLSEAGKVPDSMNVRRLYVSTFRCLRSDGVVHLEDEDRDMYLLVSVGRVLEPYARALLGAEAGGGEEDGNESSASSLSSLERTALRNNPPAFARRVPRGRMRAVMRSISHGRVGKASTADSEGRPCSSVRFDDG